MAIYINSGEYITSIRISGSGGSVYLSPFPNLLNFTGSQNSLVSVNGIDTCTKLTSCLIDNNKITILPSLGQNTVLQTFQCHNNLSLSGTTLPSLNTNTGLRSFRCDSCGLSGPIPSLSDNTALATFQCNTNQLSGPIPSLSANTSLSAFYCYVNQLSGPIPSLNTNTALQYFYCDNNSLTGPIPSLSANTNLVAFRGGNNQLSGPIPSLTANTKLSQFQCFNNQLTGYSDVAVPASLSDFRASTNQLSSTAVNKILAAFVAINRINGILQIAGAGNGAPTGQGLTDKATLIGRGWTVTTN